jgi:hypothetical protein
VSHPDEELLAALALGEPVDDSLHDHVAACSTCQDEVAALREALDAVRPPHPELVPPPAGLRATALAAATGVAEAAAPVDELATRRAVRAASAREPRGRSRHYGPVWLAGAAAAGLVVGGLGVQALDRSPQPQTVVVAQASLDTLDTGVARGSADLVEEGGSTDLAVHTDSLSAGNGYLEVWLINKDGERMVSVGVLEPGSTDQTFTIPAELVHQGYVIVDISREAFDDDATHSGDSLVRGTFPV